MPVEELCLFASILNCRQGSFPLVYSTPIGGNPRRSNLWQSMLNRMRKKLSSWMQKTLSFEGRLCLLNSILTALPLFFPFFLSHTKGVEKEAKNIMRTFLWGGIDASS